jgi:hypothetical protein
MHAITLPAKCINKHIVHTEPMEISENSDLLVVILPRALQPETSSSFQRDWAMIGAAGLERAYSEEDPEYTHEMLKVANPDFVAG